MGMKLVCDMTAICKSNLSEKARGYLMHFSESDEKVHMLFNMLASSEISFNSDHYYNIPFECIKEGDILIADVGDLIGFRSTWAYIHIDHIYRNMIFYTEIESKIEGKCEVGSLFFSKCIYPCAIVKHPDYIIICDCPFTKIVDNICDVEDDSDIYEYKIREKEDY